MIARTSLLLLCLWCLPGPVAGQEGTPEDGQQLAALLETVRNAVNTRDVKVLNESFAESFSATMIDQKVITTRKELEDYYRQLFTGEKAIIKSLVIAPEADALTRLYDGRFGAVHGTNTENYELFDGRKFTLHSKWTAAVVKEEGRWKISAIHNGVDFTDNPLLAETRKSRIYFAVLGIVAGVIAGVLIPWSPY